MKMAENSSNKTQRGKGDIVPYEQFLLYSVFKRLVLQTQKNQGLFGKGLTLSQTTPGFYGSGIEAF